MQNELSGQTAGVRTGNLRRSVITYTWSDAGGIGGFVGMAKGPADRYAAMVHEGGAIYPKKGKYLAVPLPAALTGSGVIKGEYNVSNLRSLKLACIRTKAGNLILADTSHGSMGTSTEYSLGGRGGMMSRTTKRKRFGFTPLFILKPMVYLPSRPYLEGPAERLRGSLTGQLESKINDVLN
jgi:hypothetical protein